MTGGLLTFRRHEEGVLLAGLAALVAVLSLLPLVRLLAEGLSVGGVISTEPLKRVLANPATWIATRNSLESAIGGTALAVALGSAVALVVALTDFRARNAFVFCFVLPLMIAPQVTALAWLQVTGPASPLLGLLGIAPPMRPVPEPRGTIGTCSRRQRRTMAATCAADSGSTTASGVPL